MVDDVDESRTHSTHCTPHDSPDFTTGTVALLLNRMPFHPAKQQPIEKFSAPSVLSVDKKWVAGDQSAPSFFVWFVDKNGLCASIHRKQDGSE